MKSIKLIHNFTSQFKILDNVRFSSTISNSENLNELNIQMIDDYFQSKLFNGIKCNKENIHEVKSELKKFDLDITKSHVKPIISFDLPKLFGSNIDEHFREIAEQNLNPYLKLLNEVQNMKYPTRPRNWNFVAGWTKYDPSLPETCISIPVPDDDILFFDVETIVPESNLPTVAIALGRNNWYSWTSPNLINSNIVTDTILNMEHLIPFRTDSCDRQQHKCIIGHFVGFDRARVRDEYHIMGTKTRFVDTMSLFIAICGMTTLQKHLKKSYDKDNFNNQIWKKYFTQKRMSETMELNSENVAQTEMWINEASFNSLEDVYKHYYPKSNIIKDKEARNLLVEGSTSIVLENYQKILDYCSSDVLMTAKIFHKLWPEVLNRTPHPISIMGMLEMGSTYLPLNDNWCRFKRQSTSAFNRTMHKEHEFLVGLAKDGLKYQENDRYRNDPWLWDLDWSITRNNLLPKWYRALVSSKANSELKESNESLPEPDLITSSMRVAVKLLKMKWDGLPLHYDKKMKWGVLVPGHYIPQFNDPRLINIDTGLVWPLIPVEKASPTSVELLDFPIENYINFWSVQFIKRLERFVEYISTKDVRSSLYKKLIENIQIRVKFLPINSNDKTKIMEMLSQLETIFSQKKTNYKNSKDLTVNAMYFFQVNDFGDLFKVSHIYDSLNPDVKFCWFQPLPHENGAGNFVGSPLSKSFLNHIETGRLTSEDYNHQLKEILDGKKSCVFWRNYQDRVESQVVVNVPEENHMAILPPVVIAGTVTRRAVERLWMTASNSSKDKIGSELKAMVQPPAGWVIVGADVDSQEQWIAAVLGDSVTGWHGGTPLGWLILQGNKEDGTDLHSQTSKMIGISRDAAKVLNYSRIYGAGIKKSRDTLMKYNSNLSSKEALSKITQLMAQTKGIKSKTGWVGGTESNVFTKLEEVALTDVPETPVLKAKISKVLEKRIVNNSFMTSRCNWVVQSSGVDYLHCLLVAVRHLIDEYQIQARLCLCIHDEVRYLCHSNDQYRLALALQIANLYTRAMFAFQLGLDDLPQSVAFFSEIEIDNCLRKNPHNDCITPSNSEGMKVNYNIHEGESLTIYDILKKTGGRLD